MIRKIKGSKTLKRIHAYNYQFYLKYYNNWELLEKDLEESWQRHLQRSPNVQTISSREEMLRLEAEGNLKNSKNNDEKN